MKRLFYAVTMAVLTTNAMGQNLEVKEVVVHDVQHHLAVVLDSTTVLCSEADYGALFLKILIPQLANLTLLDHRNEGAGAPCVGAGICRSEMFPDGNLPEDIINPAAPTQTIDLRIQLVRVSYLDHALKTCQVTLEERIATAVRGVPFTHERRAELGHRNFADCL